MTIISVSLDKTMLEELDKLQSRLGFSGRSELFRTALKMLIEESRQPVLSGEQNALLFIVHADSFSFTGLRHDYEEIIETHVHHHLKDKKCSELLLLKGDAKEIKEFHNQLRKNKKIDLVKLIFT